MTVKDIIIGRNTNLIFVLFKEGYSRAFHYESAIADLKCEGWWEKMTSDQKQKVEELVDNIRGFKMKDTYCMLKRTFSILTELEAGIKDDRNFNKAHLQGQLTVLYDILGECIPEEYWERIENALLQ